MSISERVSVKNVIINMKTGNVSVESEMEFVDDATGETRGVGAVGTVLVNVGDTARLADKLGQSMATSLATTIWTQSVIDKAAAENRLVAGSKP